MKSPVIAIGLDAADPVLLEKWMSQGHLKNLSRIRQQGTYSRLNNTVEYCGDPAEFSSTEPLWVAFATGCRPSKTGFWDTVKFHPDGYEIVCDKVTSGYNFKEYAPFYALGDPYRVVAFDVPVSTVVENVNGLQITGWGGHFPFSYSQSEPADLLPSVVKKYGENPILHNDHGHWWDANYLQWEQQAITQSTSARAKICRDLMQQGPWDLFITAFGDTHSAGHDMWHRSQPDHPLYPYDYKSKAAAKDGDPMLKAFEDVDRAIGEILDAAPEDAYVVCFAVHGMGPNLTDMLSMMFLPEMLYRFNFPGKVAIAPAPLDQPPPPPITHPIRNSWMGEVWRKCFEPNPLLRFLKTWAPSKFLRFNQHGLKSPFQLMDEGVNLCSIPAMWYSSLWPQMKAFALPAFADGHIRVNLKGREQQGIVDLSEYDALLDEITTVVKRLRDARTGELLVREVRRTRQSAQEAIADDPKLPDADLIVIWNENPVDVIDSPDFGRIGPLTYFRPGGHRSRGFFMAKGPGIEPGTTIPEGEAVDVSPTILEMLGAPIPEHFDGKPLLKVSVPNPVG